MEIAHVCAVNLENKVKRVYAEIRGINRYRLKVTIPTLDVHEVEVGHSCREVR